MQVHYPHQKQDCLHLSSSMYVSEEAILIHSSMKAIGETQKGADTVLDALMEFFEKGLLLLPTSFKRS